MLYVGIDTALNNTAVVIGNSQKIVFAGKPFPKKKRSDQAVNPGETYGPERIRDIVSYIQSSMRTAQKDYGRVIVGQYPLGRDFFMGIEDYLLGRHQTCYETAELVGVIRNWCLTNSVGWCMNHPMKVLKYVRKAKKVTKTEIINWFQETYGKNIFKYHNIDGLDRSDIADAAVNMRIAEMAYKCLTRSDFHSDPKEAISQTPITNYTHQFSSLITSLMSAKKVVLYPPEEIPA